jgi:hypothetical protein
VAGTDCRIEARYGAGKAQVTYQGNSRSSEDYPKEQHLGACIRSGLHGLAEGVERDVPKRRRKAFLCFPAAVCRRKATEIRAAVSLSLKPLFHVVAMFSLECVGGGSGC